MKKLLKAVHEANEPIRKIIETEVVVFNDKQYEDIKKQYLNYWVKQSVWFKLRYNFTLFSTYCIRDLHYGFIARALF